MHLDTVCTMVDVDAVVMYPNIADTLQAYTVTDGGELHVTGPEPFLVAAAKAMGIDTLRVIDTGLDPITAEREQWDDGNNTLAIGPRLAVAYERNVETNARLEEAGIEVVRIAGSELGSGRGGPRCMSCPISREPLAVLTCGVSNGPKRRISSSGPSYLLRTWKGPSATDGGCSSARAWRQRYPTPAGAASRFGWCEGTNFRRTSVSAG